MTPEVLAALQARAYTHMAPWKARDFADLLARPTTLLCAVPQAFCLGQVVVDEAEILALAADPAHPRVPVLAIGECADPRIVMLALAARQPRIVGPRLCPTAILGKVGDRLVLGQNSLMGLDRGALDLDIDRAVTAYRYCMRDQSVYGTIL